MGKTIDKWYLKGFIEGWRECINAIETQYILLKTKKSPFSISNLLKELNIDKRLSEWILALGGKIV